ncbi:MAG: hypothetical protein LBK03_08730 [Bacteroidales bacterium]|nr:hypothetical protein [Bacteroidales bacterium]
MALSQISVVLSKDFSKSTFDSFLDTGPNAIFYITITNECDTFFPINYCEWSFGCFYSYKGKTYVLKHVPFPEPPFIRVLFAPKETFSFSWYKSILLYYDIRENKKQEDYDYAKKMLDIIPTIRVYAISPDGNIYFSDSYKNIIIRKNENQENYKDILNVDKFLKRLSKKN